MAAEGLRPHVSGSDAARSFSWFGEDGAEIALGSLPPKTSTIDLAPNDSGVIALRLAGDARRGWPSDVTISLNSEDAERWRVTVPAKLAGKLRRIRVPAGRYAITATVAHHLGIERFGVDVRASKNLALGEFRFRPALMLTAAVVDARGFPVASVPVLSAEDGRSLGVGEPNGVVSLELPPVTPKAVEMRAPGYAPHRVELRDTQSDLALGTITLHRGGALRVTVDRTLVGDPPITVDVLHAERRGQRFRTVASKTLGAAETTAQFPAIEAGAYTLLLRGASPLERHAEELTIGDADRELAVRLEPATVTGQVLVGERPLAGGVLSLQPEGHAWEEEIPLDERGMFTAEVWQKGPFIGFAAGGHLKSGAFVREPLEVATDPTHWRIVIAERRIKGRVYEKATGAPFPFAFLEARSWFAGGGNGLANIPVAPDGTYAIEAAPPAEYELVATVPDHIPASRRLTLAEDDATRVVDFAMEPGRLLSLLVVTPAGNPIPSAVVVDGLGDGLNPDASYFTDAAGRLEMHVQGADAKTLYILPREGSFAIVEFRAPEMPDATPQRVTVPAASGDLHIHVASVDGRPLAGVTPVVRYEGRFLPPPIPRFLAFADSRAGGLWTNENGDAVMKAVPSGLYEVFACRGAVEIAAALRGAPVREPTRIGFVGDEARLTIVLP